MIAFDIYQPVTCSSYNKTEMFFDERMIKRGDIKMNPDALVYFQEEMDKKENNSDLMYLRFKFNGLLHTWNRETAFSSSVSDIINNNNFKSIVSYGERIIPIILEEIAVQPSNIVWALNLITGKNISDKPLGIEDACKRWVKWGYENKIIK